jgi:hypothetical protein
MIRSLNKYKIKTEIIDFILESFTFMPFILENLILLTLNDH